MTTNVSTGAREAGRERRSEPRFRVDLPLPWRLGRQSGTAVVEDLSISGARIEGAVLQPACGDVLDLGLCLSPDTVPVKFRAEVVRHTAAGGFAVQFHSVKPLLREELASILPRIGAPC